jgi:ketosteroid isomerase-like protein
MPKIEAPFDLQKFVLSLSIATNSHDFTQVAPLIHPDARYFFSNGNVMNGIGEIQDGFESTWQRIQSELYRVDEIKWRMVLPHAALYVYRFDWSGIVNGSFDSGEGRGIQLLQKTDDRWQVLRQRLVTDNV